MDRRLSDVYTILGVSPACTEQPLRFIDSVGARSGLKVSPSGENLTDATVSDTTVMVILTGLLREPDGTLKVCPPAVSVPPAVPIVAEVDTPAYLVHLMYLLFPVEPNAGCDAPGPVLDSVSA